MVLRCQVLDVVAFLEVPTLCWGNLPRFCRCKASDFRKAPSQLGNTGATANKALRNDISEQQLLSVQPPRNCRLSLTDVRSTRVMSTGSRVQPWSWCVILLFLCAVRHPVMRWVHAESTQ